MDAGHRWPRRGKRFPRALTREEIEEQVERRLADCGIGHAFQARFLRQVCSHVLLSRSILFSSYHPRLKLLQNPAWGGAFSVVLAFLGELQMTFTRGCLTDETKSQQIPLDDRILNDQTATAFLKLAIANLRSRHRTFATDVAGFVASEEAGIHPPPRRPLAAQGARFFGQSVSAPKSGSLSQSSPSDEEHRALLTSGSPRKSQASAEDSQSKPHDASLSSDALSESWADCPSIPSVVSPDAPPSILWEADQSSAEESSASSAGPQPPDSARSPPFDHFGHLLDMRDANPSSDVFSASGPASGPEPSSKYATGARRTAAARTGEPQPGLLGQALMLRDADQSSDVLSGAEMPPPLSAPEAERAPPARQTILMRDLLQSSEGLSESDGPSRHSRTGSRPFGAGQTRQQAKQSGSESGDLFQVSEPGEEEGLDDAEEEVEEEEEEEEEEFLDEEDGLQPKRANEKGQERQKQEQKGKDQQRDVEEEEEEEEEGEEDLQPKRANEDGERQKQEQKRRDQQQEKQQQEEEEEEEEEEEGQKRKQQQQQQQQQQKQQGKEDEKEQKRKQQQQQEQQRQKQQQQKQQGKEEEKEQKRKQQQRQEQQQKQQQQKQQGKGEEKEQKREQQQQEKEQNRQKQRQRQEQQRQEQQRQEQQRQEQQRQEQQRQEHQRQEQQQKQHRKEEEKDQKRKPPQQETVQQQQRKPQEWQHENEEHPGDSPIADTVAEIPDFATVGDDPLDSLKNDTMEATLEEDSLDEEEEEEEADVHDIPDVNELSHNADQIGEAEAGSDADDIDGFLNDEFESESAKKNRVQPKPDGSPRVVRWASPVECDVSGQ
jgi:hypothetical protein